MFAGWARPGRGDCCASRPIPVLVLDVAGRLGLPDGTVTTFIVVADPGDVVVRPGRCRAVANDVVGSHSTKSSEATESAVPKRHLAWVVGLAILEQAIHVVKRKCWFLAHLVPHRLEHWLRGYLGVDTHYRLRVSPRIRDEFGNGEQFYARAGR